MIKLDSKIKELDKLNEQVDKLVEDIYDLIKNKTFVYINVRNNRWTKYTCTKFTFDPGDLKFGTPSHLVLSIPNREPFNGYSEIYLWFDKYQIDWSFDKKDLTKTFKKGDRVQIIKYGDTHKGTVTCSDNIYTNVIFDGTDHEMFFRTGELELIK